MFGLPASRMTNLPTGLMLGRHHFMPLIFGIIAIYVSYCGAI